MEKIKEHARKWNKILIVFIISSPLLGGKKENTMITLQNLEAGRSIVLPEKNRERDGKRVGLTQQKSTAVCFSQEPWVNRCGEHVCQLESKKNQARVQLIKIRGTNK